MPNTAVSIPGKGPSSAVPFTKCLISDLQLSWE
jgi:hypothetical protein